MTAFWSFVFYTILWVVFAISVLAVAAVVFRPQLDEVRRKIKRWSYQRSFTKFTNAWENATSEWVGVSAELVGTAQNGTPSAARLRDGGGKMHQIWVEPYEKETIPSGSRVFLVTQVNTVWRVVRCPL